jgi:hypothetical protein
VYHALFVPKHEYKNSPMKDEIKNSSQQHTLPQTTGYSSNDKEQQIPVKRNLETLNLLMELLRKIQ